MSNQSTNEVMTQQLALLKSKIFDQCPVEDVIEYVDKMHDNYICSDSADDCFERNVATVCKKPLIKLLRCVQACIDPEGNITVSFTMD